MPLIRRLPPLFWPLLVLALSFATTGWLWRHEQQTQEQQLRSNFDYALRGAVTRIEQRLGSYEQMLRGLRGLYEASDEVSADDFERYVEALMGGADFAGLRHLAYAPLAPGRRSAAITVVAPAGDRAESLRGVDVLAQPAWRTALLRARDSGSVAMSERVLGAVTPGAEPEAGFLLFMPVYEAHQASDTVALRQARLAGWIVATVRMADLMSSLYGEGTPGVDVVIFDGALALDERRMFPARAVAAPQPGELSGIEYIGFAGHAWTVQMQGRAEFARRGDDITRLIAFTGCGFGLLLALLTWQLVTASERANAAARAMTHALRDSAERYRRIVDTANEGIWTVDADHGTTFANPKLQALLGWRADEMRGRHCSDFVDDAGVAAITSDAGDAGGQSEAQLRRRDGELLWVQLATSTITDAEGRAAGVLVMVTDIHERRLAEQRRNALEAQLQQSQKMEAIGTLAGGIAHDFNNILAATLGQVALLQQELHEQPGAAERLAQIRLASERARSLVQQIVAFSRRQPQALTVQPLQPLVAEAAALLRSTLPAQVALDLRLADAPLHAGVDATQFQQVLMNLCTNAWHALQGGTGRIEVGLEAATLAGGAVAGLAAGDYVHLSVADDGCGMDETTLQRAFEPFFTTKPVGQGTGLGLAVVHGIVVSHGGAITAQSRRGDGSRFDLYFPRVAAPPPALRGGGEAAAPRGAGEHVLYVDDDPVMVVLAQELLQRLGYRVSGETDPRAALSRLQAAPAAFDLVVSDHNMPGLTGLDLAQALAAAAPGLPVVITSGYVSDTMREQVLRAGVHEVIRKEYMLEQLGRAVHAALASRRSAEPARAQ